MAKEHEEYRGKEISYREDSEDPELVIADSRIEVVHEEKGYYTVNLPYAHYSSLPDLAEDLVDNWPEIEPALEGEAAEEKNEE